MAFTSNVAATSAIGKGRLVYNSGSAIVVSTGPTEGPIYVTTEDCAAGAYPVLASIGESVELVTDGSVVLGSVITSTTAGAARAAAFSGSTAGYSIGFSQAADINTTGRVVFLPARNHVIA